MKKQLRIDIGQATSAGKKAINQDSFGALIPQNHLRHTKGIAIAVADGISSSDVSHIASQTAINSFLSDYYATSETWSVKTACQRVLQATNSWLYAQSQRSANRFNKDKGYITTFSALVLKSNTAHLLHIGDSVIAKIEHDKLIPITEAHRHYVSNETSYLTRGLGLEQKLNIDYHQQPLQIGDLFLLATDGLFDYLSADHIAHLIQAHENDLNHAAKTLVQHALEAGSEDNITLQLIRIKQLPEQELHELYQHNKALRIPPNLEARATFEHLHILRPIYISSRSHVYLAHDNHHKHNVIVKTPSTEMRDQTSYLDQFLLEEWIGQRLNHPNLLKIYPPMPQRQHLYMVSEYIEGHSLKQWMIDNPKPTLSTVRQIVTQIASGLQAMHRQEMIHQDIRPDNIMIDDTGTIKIIDFGATQVAGLTEMTQQDHQIKGTLQYTAPEYFLGKGGSARSDIFSLGVISYQLISGALPYHTAVSKATTPSAQRKLRYHHLNTDLGTIPDWVDLAIAKAVHPNPLKRYREVAEFVYDITQANPQLSKRQHTPILERNPVLLWQIISLCLLIIIILQWL